MARYGKQKTRSKKYSRRRLRQGGVSRRSSATPSSATPSRTTPSRASTRSASAKPTPGKVVIRNSVPVSHSRGRTPSRAPSRAPPKTSLRNAGISKDDAEALQAARIISNFPYDMDKFLDMVIKNYELLNYEGVKLALREKISINEDPAVGRLSTNGILFISYICGKLVCLLNELSTLPKSKVDKKRSLLYRIKQIERVICLLDGVGCSWGIRPYSKTEMDNIAEYYRKIKDDAGLQEYHQQLNEFINKYFPVLTKYTDPSHVVSSSMCRRLIPGNIIHRLSTIGEEE
jgi:hypothetical protein